MNMENNRLATAVQAQLNLAQQQVSQITDPATGQPVQIQDLEALQAAAARLDTAQDAASNALMIHALLGRASSAGCAVPGDSLSFPADHHLHMSMGAEWYWVGCHLTVEDTAGNVGRIAFLTSMQKTRIVSPAVQQQAGWSDLQSSVFTNVSTLVVDYGPGNQHIYRRTPNRQWPGAGGGASYSQPGDTSFYMTCGPDSLHGDLNVVPLTVQVNDGDNMQVNLTLSPNSSINVETAFFKQGVPQASLTDGGTGLTPVPTPGIYYSWPQLDVSGQVTVGGQTYTVLSGTGWLDHQLMMTSLSNADNAQYPVPFVEDPTPYNGWVWQFYNLNNGEAFTGAAFIVGDMSLSDLDMSYGYFLKPENGAWKAIFINGKIDLLYPYAFNGQSICTEPTVIPVARTYRKVENGFLGDPLSGVASPWFYDGTFEIGDGAICSETPADYVDMSGKYANGVGYMESIGFTPVGVLREAMLAKIAG